MIRNTAHSGLALSIGQYLIQRLQDYGIADVFGIPGDYVLSFYSQLETSEVNIVGCTREDYAGFAADAYARVNGMGALLHHLLRGWSQCLQFGCRCVCREITRGGDHWIAGDPRALDAIRSCITWFATLTHK